MEISPKEQTLLRQEIQAFLAGAKDIDTKGRYAELLRAVDAADIPEGQVRLLEQMLETGLEGGRIRLSYGPDGEQVFIRVYQKTPKGKAVQNSIAEVNQALQVLQRHVIEEVAFAVRGPGGYRLVIDTDRCKVTVGVDREGLRVEGLDVGI